MKLENVEVLENTAVTLKDIRKYTESYSEVLAYFKRLRDSVGHGLLISEIEIRNILFAEDFESILSKFDFEENFCKELQKTFNLVAKKSKTKSMNEF